MDAPIGTVTLVGAGPGDPDLLTIAATKALAAADVVFYDRLAPREALDRHARQAELVPVGKTPGHHPVGQDAIETAIIGHALAGRTVVRFKGGDPFVFGRGAEELLACRTAGVPITVIPGITSAFAVPAEAGIPVTHRAVSRMVTVVSGHVPFDTNELRHLAGLGGTIVVLMGVATLAQTCIGLRAAGLGAETPCAVIENGFTSRQRTTRSTLDGLAAAAARAQLSSPAVIVIGDVVAVTDVAPVKRFATVTP
ncbi:uroporphyrinogen-III C-methyltransferase [Paramicrobacterium fandaimingii]|uniref:uroporphyrinogen-III C-methyltransferase n=1 Tax=Paramicrobacterium fandaimingii TaxID=2708079 RepID=UPI0014241FDE|nr:uroporphyrinogen-III C-methyltransferase [Microbacterium fandaimingii]